MHLFSASGIFRLGFFKLGSSNSNLSYVGIWYNNGLNEKPVWVANRNNPVPDESGTIGIDRYGNLKISHNNGDPIITLYSAQSPINARATLLDSGNFVLRESSNHLWQSFDYPTDTLLPKMKLGFDRRTGLNRTLTSWRTDDFPALGSFTLAINSDQMVVWWRGSNYWESGPWRDGCFDPLQDEFCDHYKYKFSYVSNEEETYMNYSVSKEITIFPRLSLSSDGEIKGYGMNVMFTQVSCLNSSSSSLRFGCVEQKLPSCRSSRIDHNKFVSKVGAMSRTGFKFDDKNNLTILDCWEMCLQNCSCVAYASTNGENGIGTGCEIWSKDSSFTHNNLASLREIRLLESGGGTAIFPLVISSLYVLLKKCKAKRNRQRKEHTLLLQELGKAGKRHKDANELQLFSFERISSATNGFSASNKLGGGGFGPVYKAWQLWSEGRCVELVDSGLVEYKLSEVLNGIHIGLLCVQERPEDRPTMPDVVSMLSSDTTLLPLPKQPAFFISDVLIEDVEVGIKKAQNCSLNDVTMSVMEAR
ncbi:hypothetical protein F8388_027140 [Cannabis sativa]|uniref:Uncharacterized protein n=1 Tax=Cannabis sativa TaxID=3483 RepID=A0A7J6FP99_CANSA|nr:hypothetical protein F8388_027140 [Cannabis sativa]